MLEYFNELSKDSPEDKIIVQIRGLITSGQLKPGDRLPPERKLAQKLGVGRTAVRDALRKLEFYGILKTLPQSGTFVAGIGLPALEGLITDVLKLEKSDFKDLVETRVILESNGAKLAAERRTEEDIVEMKTALDAYALKVKSGANAVEEDLLFHLKVAEASKNAVLKSLMLIITPDIIKQFISFKVCDETTELKALEDHQNILTAIINKDGEKASSFMEAHLEEVVTFSMVSVKDLA